MKALQIIFLLIFAQSLLAQTHKDRVDILTAKAPDKAQPGFVDGFKIDNGQTIALVGGSNLEFEDRYGWLELRLRKSFHQKDFKVRNLAWEGDTVFERQRDVNFGSLVQHLSYLSADIVFLQFGQMEVYGNEGDLAAFTERYKLLMDEVAKVTNKVVVLSPLLLDSSSISNAPVVKPVNEKLLRYSKVIKQLAASKKFIYVDFTSASTKDLTREGLHLTEKGHEVISEEIGEQLGLKQKNVEGSELFRAAIIEKNNFWREFYRPLNWCFAYGDRARVPFGQGFKTVASSYGPILDNTEKQLQEMTAGLAGRMLKNEPGTVHKHSEVEYLTPEQEIKSMEIPNKNLQFNLFASEKDGIVNPVRMKWDRFGRLWVCCMPSYPQPDPGQKPHDYILICEDTDKDGRADKFTRFAEGLFLPMGIEFDENGVYVCEGSDLVYYDDKDHDGKPESKKVILSGFGTGDTHQNINSVNWGNDGYLWFTQGHHAFANVETLHGVIRLERGGVFRYNTRTGRLEAFYGGSKAGHNNWGVTVNKWGEGLHVSGANPNIYDSLIGAVEVRQGPRFPYGICHTKGTKKCGLEYVESKHFPEEMQGQLLTATFYTSQINTFKISEENGQLQSEELTAMIPKAHRAFRPLEIKNGPNGALYVLDWYNEIIGHYQASYKDPRRDKAHGRVWRVTYKNRPLTQDVDFNSKSTEELLAYMSSDSAYKRRVARRLLFSRPQSKVFAELKKLESSKDAALLVSLLGVYQAHEIVDEPLLKKLLSHTDPKVRGAGVMALGRWCNRLDDSYKMLLKASQDENPRVRIHATVASVNYKKPEVMKLITSFLDNDANSLHYYSAELVAINTIDSWLPSFIENSRGLSVVKKNLLLKVASNYRKTEALALFRKLLKSSVQEDRLTAVQHLIKSRDKNDQNLIFESVNLKDKKELQTLLGAIAGEPVARPANYTEILKAVKEALGQDNTDLIVLASQWQDKSFRDTLLTKLSSKSLSEQDYIKLLGPASRILKKGDDAQIANLLQNKSFEVKSKASHVIFSMNKSFGCEAVLKVLKGENDRKKVLGHLRKFTANKGNASILAKAININTVDKDSSRKIWGYLRSTGYKEKTLLDALFAVFSKKVQVTQTSKYSVDYVAKLVKEVQAKGDAVRGKAVYHKAGMTCIACHAIDKVGGQLGPELTLLGRGSPIERVIESILWPAKEVKEGYGAATVTVKNGNTYQGYLKEETPVLVSIKLPGTDQVKSFNKKDVRKLVKGGTLMPANLLATLNHQEKVDLFAYVANLGKDGSESKIDKKGTLKYFKNLSVLPKDHSKFTKLFDGKTLKGWEGDTNWFRVENESIVAGNLKKRIPHNFFLTSEKEYYNFEMHLDFKVVGEGNNGGIQFRSKRIKNHHEMIGYQADIISNLTGNIYDESRRKKFLNKPQTKNALEILQKGWNHYVIHCENNHIRLYINGYLTADYKEEDAEITKVKGLFGLQVHGGKPVELHYKNIYIKEK